MVSTLKIMAQEAAKSAKENPDPSKPPLSKLPQQHGILRQRLRAKASIEVWLRSSCASYAGNVGTMTSPQKKGASEILKCK